MSDSSKPVDSPEPVPDVPARDYTALRSDARADEILDIVAKETSVSRSQLQLDAQISDLGIASFDMVQTIFEIESRYNVDIPVAAENSRNEFATVGDLVGHVLQTLDNRPADGKQG